VPEPYQISESAVSWYAIYTRYQHEKSIACTLACKGFETFLPLYSSARRWKDRIKQLWLPLFPCYVFVHGTLERRFDIIVTSGVHGLVSSGGRPAPIPQSEIDAIRRALEQRVAVEPHGFLRSGDWVRVKSGPLEGVEGILVRWKNLWRLVLSVELLERSVAVEVDAFSTERAVRPATRPEQRQMPEGVWAWA
jgi:transcription antitermination factor NusG